MSYDEWLLTQDRRGWYGKYNSKVQNAKKIGLKVLLTFDDYLMKGYQASISSHELITQNGYHLSRINDTGDYTIESCRFLTCNDNWNERFTEEGRKKVSEKMKGNNNALGSKGQPGNTHTQGIKHWNTKLTEEDVINIFYDPRSNSELAEVYNIGYSAIGKIKNRITWSHITKDLPPTRV